MSVSESASDNLGRIRWKCRRGMLELDLMLLKFFDSQYSDLSPEEKKQFEHLLEEPDPVLQEYLYGISAPDNEGSRAILRKINASRLC